MPKIFQEKCGSTVTNMALPDASIITNKTEDVLPPKRTPTILSM
jgi:hypothetical protein